MVIPHIADNHRGIFVARDLGEAAHYMAMPYSANRHDEDRRDVFSSRWQCHIARDLAGVKGATEQNTMVAICHVR